MLPHKAKADNFNERFREIISDPLNLLIERAPLAGTLDADGLLYLHNGLRVAVNGDLAYYGDFSRILLLNRGVHEPLEEYVFQEVLRRLPEAPVMLELGAYWAHYSMWLKSRRPQANAVMVEPESRNLAAGAHNFANNGLEGEFIQDMVGNGHFSVDEFFRERQLPKLDILHSDIQGYEVEMLTDCRESLDRRAIDFVFVSTHSQALHAEVRHLLEAAGYRIELSSDYEFETTSHDGLIFASSPDVQAVFGNFNPLSRLQIATASPRDLVESLLTQVRS